MFKCDCGKESPTKAGLLAHQRKCKPVEPVTEEKATETKETTPAETALAPLPKTSFDVVNMAGGFVRTYSVEVHGEKAEELAAEFANKINGKICQN